MKRAGLLYAALILFLPAVTPAFAETTNAEPGDLRQRLEKVEAALNALQARPESSVAPDATEEELTKLKLDLQLPEALGPHFTGLGPALSKVYFSKRPLAIGGFGDFKFVSEPGGTRTAQLARLDLNVGYRFSRNLIFNSSFAFLNNGGLDGANGDFNSGAARVETAWMDFLTDEKTGVRIGQLLVPVGILNLRPEPTDYPMVNRPRPETQILAADWAQIGVLGFGHLGRLVLQGGVVNGLDASRFEARSFVARGTGLSGNRKANSAAYVLRAEVVEDDGSYGGSIYNGNSAQNSNSIGRSELWLGEVHAELRAERFGATFLYTEGHLSDTDLIFKTTGQAVGSVARGGYAILSYDLLPRIAPIAKRFLERPPPPGWKELPVFVSWERTDLNAEPAAGQPRDASLRSDVFTMGVNYRPHPQAVLKLDLANQISSVSGADQSSRVVELGLGFVF